jgi:hypothetical protein
MGTDGSVIAFVAQAVNAFMLGLYTATTIQILTCDRDDRTVSSCISTLWVLMTAVFLAVLSLGTDDPQLGVAHILLSAQAGFVCGASGERGEVNDAVD